MLVDLSPSVFAEAVGRSLTAAGFAVQVGESEEGLSYDAVILGPGRPAAIAPISLLFGSDNRVRVRHGSETGLVSVRGPGDLVDVLRILFADQTGRIPAAQ